MHLLRRRKLSRKQRGLVLCWSVMMLLLLAGCDGAGTTTVTPTPTSPSMALVPLHLDLPAKAWNAPVTGKVPDTQPLHVGITLKLNQQILDQLSSKGIAKTGQSTNAKDIATKLGISDADYQRLKQFFGVNGATLQLSQTRTSMTLDIKAGTLARLLQTSFVLHTLDKRTFYTPDPQHQPQIPAALATYILAVTGLDNYSLPPKPGSHLSPQQVQPGTVSKQVAQAGANCDPQAEQWRQYVAQAYGYDQMWHKGWHGENMTINIVSLEATNLADLHNYFACTGFKGTLDFITVNSAPRPAKTDIGETTLDIETIAGLAPSAHIKVYQAMNQASSDGTDPMLDIFQRIFDDNATHTNFASAVSTSWGNSEEDLTGEMVKAMSQRLELLTKIEHMTIYSASGDCGAYDDDVMGSLSVDYPGSDPSVVSVGGTALIGTLISSRPKEIGWTGAATSSVCQNNDWGSGGGLSILFKRPSWQQGPGVDNKYSNGSRQVPDIAADADGTLPIYLDGKWQSGGGTSASTPIWAAGMALVNQGLIDTKQFYVYGPDTFYFAQAHAGDLKPYYDQVEGNNLYYYAGPDWDYVTGLGSPNLPVFYQVMYNNATIIS
jgi:kumamolisin